MKLVRAIWDWINVPIWTRDGEFEFRRIDALVVLGGILCVSYYGYVSGWRAALAGGALYVLIAMIALWMI